jgi:peptidoglycan/LPS O-acetylase OafA/YrhL
MVVLRGISRVTAAVTALLLIYGISYAMEAMTTRLPDTSLHEFAIGTLWMFPWMLLFCSGLEDLGKATRRAWVFWAGLAVGIALLCYL